jgi:hypothetical protein
MAVGKWQSFIPYQRDLKIRCQVSGVRREEFKSGKPKPPMRLHIVGTANRRISNIEPQNVEGWNRFAQSFFKIDRTQYFDICHAGVSLSIKLVASAARGGAEH